jgi:hypothetical protein
MRPLQGGIGEMMLQSTMRISFSLDHAENVQIEVEDENITLKEEFGNRVDVYLTPEQQLELAQKIMEKHERKVKYAAV